MSAALIITGGSGLVTWGAAGAAGAVAGGAGAEGALGAGATAACDDVDEALARVVGVARCAVRTGAMGVAAGLAAVDADAAGAGSFVNSLNVKSK
jgi:hypothetical protein